MKCRRAEYIWIDGARPTRMLRSKTKIISAQEINSLDQFPDWGFDGSSTYQADGGNSDLIIRPVSYCLNPLLKDGSYLVMCEVLNENETPHVTNTRASLKKSLDAGADKLEPWFGIEQEYTLFNGRDPLGWPKGGYPAPQGPFYCGVGADQVFGRDIVEKHTQMCIDANLMIYGTNAEVMPGQWEFQIGHRGIDGETADPLTVSDHLWIARWLLYRVAEDYGIHVRLHPKPVKGDWNGAGAHTNFSTAPMRDSSTGMKTIEEAVTKLAKKHKEHIDVYGVDVDERLTGLHETCDINTFKHGVADRGCSIRIPRSVATKGCGYIEDRRPGANIDPYEVCNIILKTICDL